MDDTLSVKKGRIILYRLFDVADKIDLSLVETRIKEGVRMRLSKYPYMKALEFSDPPVSFVLPGFSLHLFGRDLGVHVVAKAFDFGVLSLALNIPIPEGTSFHALEGVTRSLDTDETIDGRAWKLIRELAADLGDAVIRSSIKEDYTEDYMIVMVQELVEDERAQDFLNRYDPSRLLLFESRDVSREIREEVLKHAFS